MINPDAKTSIKSKVTSSTFKEILQKYFEIPQGKSIISCISPDHPDGRPSAKVYDDHVYCFSCGKSFDCFDVVKIGEQTDFNGALRVLGGHFGVILENENRWIREPIKKIKINIDHLKKKDVKPEIKVSTLIMDYYQLFLKNFSDPDNLGLRYLQSRGLDFEICNKFGVGYARPGEWKTLNSKISKIRSQKNYDYIWPYGRIIFPVFSSKGELINLSSRLVGNESKLPDVLKDIFRKNKQRHIKDRPMGYFNHGPLSKKAMALCESPIDALSFAKYKQENPDKASYVPEHITSIFGVNGIKLEDLPDYVLFAFDNPALDKAASKRYKKLIDECIFEGIAFDFLDESFYCECKDINEVLVRCSL